MRVAILGAGALGCYYGARLAEAGELSDEELVARCAGAGIRVTALSRYYHTPVPESDRHTLVVDYAAVQEEALEAALGRIEPIDTKKTAP